MVASFGAAAAPAAPGPTLFHVTVSGTVSQQWDHTEAPIATDSCEESLRSEGTRTIRFHSTRPTVMRVVDGRFSAAEVRGLTGTVRLAGPNVLNTSCEGRETHTTQPCASSRRSFGDGTVQLTGTVPGSIALGRVRNVSLRQIRCPSEPNEIVRVPLGPVPGPFHISPATLANGRITRITLTASVSRRKNYVAPEAGTLRERAEWKLTLVR